MAKPQPQASEPTAKPTEHRRPPLKVLPGKKKKPAEKVEHRLALPTSGPIYDETPQFGFCRGFAQHRWSVPNKRDLQVKNGTIIARIQCDHCDSQRVDHVARNSGMVVKREYLYADGYSIKLGGQKPIPKSQFRREFLDWIVAR